MTDQINGRNVFEKRHFLRLKYFVKPYLHNIHSDRDGIVTLTESQCEHACGRIDEKIYSTTSGRFLPVSLSVTKSNMEACIIWQKKPGTAHGLNPYCFTLKYV